MTTVGHASLMPATVLGQLLTTVLVILGYAVVAIPVGVITSEVLAAKKAREALLAGEETERREFKSSAFYSYGDPDTPQEVIFEGSVLKPVAGFLNARGGFLFIGVDDNANPLGIQADLDMKSWTTDRYVRHLTERDRRGVRFDCGDLHPHQHRDRQGSGNLRCRGRSIARSCVAVEGREIGQTKGVLCSDQATRRANCTALTSSATPGNDGISLRLCGGFGYNPLSSTQWRLRNTRVY